MKRYAPYIAAAGIFAFAAAVYAKDMSAAQPASTSVTAPSEYLSEERGVVIRFEESLPAEFTVNINTAELEELLSLPQIGEVRARAIIDYREKYGGFISVEELSEVEGFSESLLENIRAYLTV